MIDINKKTFVSQLIDTGSVLPGVWGFTNDKPGNSFFF